MLSTLCLLNILSCEHKEVFDMKFNVGTLDRAIRFVLGAVIIGAGYYYQSWWGAIGLIPILTGFVGWCPAYAVFNIESGVNSAESEEKAEFL